MLNSRQKQIVEAFEKHSPSYLAADYFVNKFGVSLRTVQSDIKQIREYFNQNDYAELVSIASKGSKLVIHDLEKYQVEFTKKKKETQKQNQSDRVRKLCILLLIRKQSVSHQYLMNQLFVASSTLNSDLKEADKLLKTYQLQIERKRNSGIIIVGSEYNKRKCLLKLGHLEIHQEQNSMGSQEEMRQDIEKILVSVLLKYHYHISDTLFQNLIVHIEMAIKRMDSGFYIRSHELEDIGFDSEVKVADEIFSKLSERFFFKISQEEIINLAIYIKGKSDYENDDYISEEVNTFILYALEEIDEKFNINFTQEIDLRISLAFHLMPLLTRIEYNIQNYNQLLDQIKQSFPLAFDIAAYMCLLLQRTVECKIEEGEIAYLAIYFNQYLVKYNDISGKQRVLIVTSLKRSESILLRQRFATWFSNEISVLTLLNIHEINNIDIENYDVIFTTEQTEDTENMGAILISFYPSESEYSKIKLAIDGFKNKFEIINLFAEQLFHYGTFSSKEEVLNRICDNSAIKVKEKVSNLRQAVGLREDFGSSYFGNQIALPHPINPISVETFVSVILLENELDWDTDHNKVRLVMLVAIEKNNAKVFQLWNYLSKIIQEKHFVDRLVEKPTFGNFKENLTRLLDEYI